MSTGADLPVLHAVRTLGYADLGRISERLDLPESDVIEQLLDAQASGWAAHSSYAGDSGWSLTEAGKQRGERLLAAELDGADARSLVEAVHRDFIPVNETVVAACTAWQLAEVGIEAQAVSSSKIIATLTESARKLTTFEERLTQRLPRFAGYSDRFTAAVNRAVSDPAWITATDRDSCHRVWFELHEDLIATLGLTR